MLEQVLLYLYGPRHYNWPIARGGLHLGNFVIGGGRINIKLLNGQYFRIVGSVFNDGVYRYTDDLELVDEEFEGAVWALAIPRCVLELAKEIKEWNEKNGAAAAGPYQSESFGGYSYTKATDAVTGGAVTWQSAFRSRLAEWRKI